MVTVVVALIALLPTIASWFNWRKRALTTLDAEIATLKSLPQELGEQRQELLDHIGNSITSYARRSRPERGLSELLAIPWAVAWLSAFLAVRVADGSLTDPEAYRETVVTGLVSVAGVSLMLAVVVTAYVSVVKVQTGWYMFRVFRARRTIAVQRRRATEGQAELTARLAHFEEPGAIDQLSSDERDRVARAFLWRDALVREAGEDAPVHPTQVTALVADYRRRHPEWDAQNLPVARDHVWLTSGDLAPPASRAGLAPDEGAH